jgi:hypothetical protein
MRLVVRVFVLSSNTCRFHCAADPSPLRDLTASANFAHARHAEPSATQTTPHSPLQLLVKGARKTIIDPVFAALDLPYDPPPLPIDAAAEEAANRAREHVKIIELKKRKLAGGGRGGGLTIRRRDVDGVFLRQDLEDESGHVDVDASAKPPASMAGVTSAVASGAIDIPMAGPSDLSMGVARTRRPSKKVQQEADVLSSNNKPGRSKKVTIIKQVSGSMPASLHTSEETLVTLGPDSELPSTALDAKGKKIKPKSDTFKLAWSIEEQHLLERLLKEHPEGSKNRLFLVSVLVLFSLNIAQMAPNITGNGRSSYATTSGKPSSEVLREAQAFRTGGRERRKDRSRGR